jgi:hypothetical protein
MKKRINKFHKYKLKYPINIKKMKKIVTKKKFNRILDDQVQFKVFVEIYINALNI